MVQMTTHSHHDQTHYKCSNYIPYSTHQRASLGTSQITIILATETLTKEVFGPEFLLLLQLQVSMI